MNSRAIVNVAVEQEMYSRFQRSVLAGCMEFGGDAELLFGGYPEGCPPHKEQNYAFKVWAMDSAIRRGFRRILWIDCRCRPVASLEPVWREMEEAGYYVGREGDALLGDWCSDDSLKIFGIDRATARKIPLLRGGVTGLRLDTAVGAAIWTEYKGLCLAGAFNGAHLNTPGKGWGDWGGGKWRGHVSDDPTVGGHRHDETALSFALWKFGLKPSEDLTNPDVLESLVTRNQ